MLVGCDQLSIVNQGHLEATFLTTPRQEIMKGGTLDVEYVMDFKPEADHEMYCIIEAYDGDSFLKGHIRKVELKTVNKKDIINDQYIMDKVESGKHKIRYEAYCTQATKQATGQTSIRAVRCDGSYVTNLASYAEQTFINSLPCTEKERHINEEYFEKLNIDYDLYPYKSTDDQIICIDYCGETEIDFIESIVIKDCESDADCSQFDADCIDGYCYKEVIHEVEVEKITPIYEDSTCSDIECEMGFDCVDEPAGDSSIAYCVQGESNLLPFIIIGGVLGIFLIIAVVVVALRR
jgi:hypothetical protein